MRAGDVCAGDPSRDLVSDVLWLSFAIEAGRLFTRSGDSGCSGDARLAGKSKELGGSMVILGMYGRVEVGDVIERPAACCLCDVVVLIVSSAVIFSACSAILMF